METKPLSLKEFEPVAQHSLFERDKGSPKESSVFEWSRFSQKMTKAFLSLMGKCENCKNTWANISPKSLHLPAKQSKTVKASFPLSLLCSSHQYSLLFWNVLWSFIGVSLKGNSPRKGQSMAVWVPETEWKGKETALREARLLNNHEYFGGVFIVCSRIHRQFIRFSQNGDWPLLNDGRRCKKVFTPFEQSKIKRNHDCFVSSAFREFKRKKRSTSRQHGTTHWSLEKATLWVPEGLRFGFFFKRFRRENQRSRILQGNRAKHRVPWLHVLRESEPNKPEILRQHERIQKERWELLQHPSKTLQSKRLEHCHQKQSLRTLKELHEPWIRLG